MAKQKSVEYRVKLRTKNNTKYVVSNFDNGVISSENLNTNFELKTIETNDGIMMEATTLPSNHANILKFTGNFERQKLDIDGNNNFNKVFLVCEKDDNDKILTIYLSTAICQFSSTFNTLNTLNDDNSGKTFKERSEDLINLFGHSKRKRSQKTKEKHKVILSSNAIESSIIEASKPYINSAPEIQVEDYSEVDDLDRLRPAYNINATEPKDVYDLSNIFPQKIWINLGQTNHELYEHRNLDTKTLCKKYGNFISDSVAKYKNTYESLRFLIYVDLLIRILNCPENQLTRFNIENLAPYKVRKSAMMTILNIYTTESNNKKHVKSKANSFILLMHIILLQLYLYDFHCNIDTIANATFKTKKEIIKVAKLLGCTIKKCENSGIVMATLPCPPKFEKPKNDLPRKKKRTR